MPPSTRQQINKVLPSPLHQVVPLLRCASASSEMNAQCDSFTTGAPMLRLLPVVHKQHTHRRTHTRTNTCTHTYSCSPSSTDSLSFVCLLALSLAHAWLRFGFVYGAPFNVVVVAVVAVVAASHLPAAARQRRRRLKLWVEENPNRQATHQHTHTLVHNSRTHERTHTQTRMRSANWFAKCSHCCCCSCCCFYRR